MAEPICTLFNQFKVELGKKTHDIEGDVLKWMLTSTPVTTAGTVKADYVAGEPAAAGGYPTGGFVWNGVTWGLSGSGLYLKGADFDFNVSGTVDPVEWAVLYNDTATNDELILFVHFGYSINLVASDVLPFRFNPTFGAWWF